MKRFTPTLSLIAYAAMILGSASAITLSTTETAMANSKCGGNHQRVCKKWEQLRGCDAGYHRTKLIGGICTHDNKLIPNSIENKLHKVIPHPFRKSRELHDAAKRIARGTVAQQRVLAGIVSCIGRNKKEFRRAVKSKNKKAASAISYRCINTNSMSVLRSAPTSGVSTRGTHSRDGYFKTLSIGVSGGAIIFVGGGAETGIVFALEGRRPPRFYTSRGFKWGAGLGGSVDVVAGLSRDALSPGKSYNWSVNAEAHYLAGAGVGVVFNRGFLPPSFNGISVSGGGGLSVEVGVVENTWSRIY